MINKYKENTKHYIKCCCCCRSQFTFQYEDIKNGYVGGSYHDYVVCPYCNEINKVGKLLKPTKKDYHSDVINVEKLKIEIENNKEEIDNYKAEIKRITSAKDKIVEDMKEKVEHEKHNNNVLENKIKYFITKNKNLNDTVNAYSIHFASKKGNISKQELLAALDVISESIEVE